MSLHLVTAPHLTPLVDRLAGAMARAPLPPREEEVIVVQSQGMRRWLTLQLADTFGCAGGLSLPFPATFVRGLEGRLSPERVPRREVDPFAREVLTWRIDTFLRELPAGDEWQALHRYLSSGDDRARFGLAGQIAARFDDYQMFRADLLADWEAGGSAPESSPHARWQGALWRVLCAGGDGALHLGARLRRTIARLHDDAPPGLPARVTVFGVSTLPPLFVELLAALARHVPVTVYSATIDAESPHPLATAFATQSREFIEDVVRHGAERHRLEAETLPGAGLLATLQRELATNASGDTPLAVAVDDASLRIHDAHGELRQLEILRDQLLAALADDPTLRPHDCLLLVPDAAEWAPLVDAVFGVEGEQEPQIPFRIADRPLRRTQPAAEALSRLLALEGRRLERSEVLGFLSHPFARTAAGLTAAEVEELGALLQRANVRWGYNGESRRALGFAPYEDATWRAGLDRLLLGTVTGRGDDEVLGLLPEAGDTIGDPELVANFASWVDDLASSLAEWRHDRTLRDWSATLLGVVDRFLAGEDAREQQLLLAVTSVLRRLVSLGEVAAHDGLVPFAVVRDWLEGELDDEGFGSGFLQGGMTVAALKPMRSLPFRVIAVAGLDDGVFPRRDRRSAFDLLEHERRPGDRDLRGDDRQLFLDLLMAARDRLILAHSGRAVSDNSVRAPSVVLDELLDHLDRRAVPVALSASPESAVRGEGAARGALVVRHPLQPFSPAYFLGGSDRRLFTYSRAQARAAAARATRGEGDYPFIDDVRPVPLGDGGRFELTLRDLSDCWKNPSRFFCSKVLRFSLDDTDVPSTDDDIFSPTHLERGGVRAAMLKAALDGVRDEEREARRMLADGKLPPHSLGKAWHARLDAEVREVLEEVPLWEAARRIPITLSGDGWRLKGQLEGIRGDTRYVVRAGPLRAEHRVQAWVEHVVLCAAHEAGIDGVPAHTRLVGKGKSRGKPAVETLPAVRDATALLDRLVAATRDAYVAPLPFFPIAGWAWREARYPAPARTKGAAAASPADPRARAVFAFRKTSSRFDPLGGDGEDPYVALCFRGVDPMLDRWDDFERLAALLFSGWPQGAGQP